MELWDVYNKDRSKTGKKIERGRRLSEGEFHLVVYVCVFNSYNQMLIQQRQPFKDGFPNMWDFTAGGSAVSGDSSNSAASRELFEEIGLKIDFEGIVPHFTINCKDAIADFYLVNKDTEIDTLKLQYEEVQAVKWASQKEILDMIDSREFIPHHKSLVDLCFDMRESYGTRQKCAENYFEKGNLE